MGCGCCCVVVTGVVLLFRYVEVVAAFLSSPDGSLSGWDSIS